MTPEAKTSQPKPRRLRRLLFRTVLLGLVGTAVFIPLHQRWQREEVARLERVRDELRGELARLIATVLPSLEVFNTQAAIATGAMVPPEYLACSALYCAAYCTAAILLAFILFEDRDLA